MIQWLKLWEKDHCLNKQKCSVSDELINLSWWECGREESSFHWDNPHWGLRRLQSCRPPCSCIIFSVLLLDWITVAFPPKPRLWELQDRLCHSLHRLPLQLCSAWRRKERGRVKGSARWSLECRANTEWAGGQWRGRGSETSSAHTLLSSHLALPNTMSSQWMS